MAAISLRSNVMKSLENGIEGSFQISWESSARGDHPGFIREQLESRVAYLFVLVIGLGCDLVDTALGIPCGALQLLSAGNLASSQSSHLLGKSLRFLASDFASHFIHMINPDANEAGEATTFRLGFESRIDSMARSESSKTSLIRRHVRSRLAYGMLALAEIVAHTFRLIIGATCFALSVITLGNFEATNAGAVNGMTFLGIVPDLLYCLTKIINPQAEISFDRD